MTEWGGSHPPVEKELGVHCEWSHVSRHILGEV